MRTERGRVRITFFEVLCVIATAIVLQAIVGYARTARGAEPVGPAAAAPPGPVLNVRSCRVVVCGFGSGFSIGEIASGRHVVLTAAHVIRGATRVDVGVAKQWREVRVLASDAKHDVAVLGLVNGLGLRGEEVAHLTLADRDAVPGQAVRWIGCPGAGPVREGSGTATAAEWFAPHPIEGDSGGPVVDAATGEVVGLVVTRGADAANANTGGMVPVSILRRLVVQACGGLPPVQDRLTPTPDPGMLPPSAPAPGPFAVGPQPAVPGSAPAPPAPVPVPPSAPSAANHPDVAGLAGAVAKAVAPKLVPALLPFLPEGLAAVLVPAAVASGPVGLGILAGGAVLRLLRRRRSGRGPPPTPVAAPASPTPGGGPGPAEPFRRPADPPVVERLVPRDLREAHQLQQLRKLEGRHPALDATVGMVALDVLENEIDAESKLADVARAMKSKIMARVDEIAPLSAEG